MDNWGSKWKLSYYIIERRAGPTKHCQYRVQSLDNIHGHIKQKPRRNIRLSYRWRSPPSEKTLIGTEETAVHSIQHIFHCLNHLSLVILRSCWPKFAQKTREIAELTRTKHKATYRKLVVKLLNLRRKVRTLELRCGKQNEARLLRKIRKRTSNTHTFHVPIHGGLRRPLMNNARSSLAS